MVFLLIQKKKNFDLIKNKLKLKRISFEDWIENFDLCEICNLTPEIIIHISEKDWENFHLISVLINNVSLIN